MDTNEWQKQNNSPERPKIVIENIGVLRGLVDLNLRGLKEEGLGDTKEYKDMEALNNRIKPMSDSARLSHELLTEYKSIVDRIQVATRSARYEAFKSSKTAVDGIIKQKK